MVLTPSQMPSLGTKAKKFNLIDVRSNTTVSLNDCKSEHGLAIVFMCNHCPFVKHIINVLTTIANYYTQKGFSIITINSNDVVNFPDDSPKNMKKLATELNFKFPYLFDETQQVAKSYQAECTPDFFIYDKDLKLSYRGQFDESRPSNDIPVTGNLFKQAIECLIQNKPIELKQKPSIGCSIKWK